LQQSLQGNNNTVSAPDFTFITNSLPAGNNGRTGGLNTTNTDNLANDVMTSVANEMGLINSEDLQILEEHANLPPRWVVDLVLLLLLLAAASFDLFLTFWFVHSLLTQELERMLKAGNGSKDDYLSPYNERQMSGDSGYPTDRVPGQLFSTTIAQQGVPATISGQPVVLKTAMKYVASVLSRRGFLDFISQFCFVH
jgi:hypothetical protein